MRLTVIGCSGSLPGPRAPASCYLLEADGFRLVADLGNGALGVLQRHVGLNGVDAVCLSHLHADHCLDMCPYWVGRSYGPGGPGPRIPVYGPEGTARRLDLALGPGGQPGMSARFSFTALAPGIVEIGPFRVSLAHMNHPVETFGFRFEHAGSSVTYSADTGESAALVELARGTDLLLCEATFLTGPGLPEDLHLTAQQAAGHAARAGAGHLVLTHVPPWNDPAKTLAEAHSAAFGGPISLAASGASFDVG